MCVWLCLYHIFSSPPYLINIFFARHAQSTQKYVTLPLGMLCGSLCVRETSRCCNYYSAAAVININMRQPFRLYGDQIIMFFRDYLNHNIICLMHITLTFCGSVFEVFWLPISECYCFVITLEQDVGNEYKITKKKCRFVSEWMDNCIIIFVFFV